ncbi:MAG: formimidoylglutamate deiminase [Actinomycetota bacterium]
MTSYLAEHAWLPSGVVRDVRILVDDSRITAIDGETSRRPGDVPVAGLVLPGFANTHSHAFHRALRGRTHDGSATAADTFWSWRQAMYAIAGRLDPDSYLALATATFAEMALAGVTSVGEFHYLHHARGGLRYADPNAMGQALIQAADQAGIRITLLDSCYLTGGLTSDGPIPLSGEQLRFGDGSVDAWAERVSALRDGERVRIGAAIHSVRAVPAEAIPVVAAAGANRALHMHLSEQPVENEQCLAAYGTTPTALLHQYGALGVGRTAVHATHLTDGDITVLGDTGTGISMSPTTERDLADGIGPARRLLDAGSPITLGSDQHAVIDLLEEARALEMDERLASGRRVRFTPAELVEALTAAGQRSLGWEDAGMILPGSRADLVAIRLDSTRTAGSAAEQAILAATAAEVHTVIADGRVIVRDGAHVLGDVGRLLAEAIAPLWE